MAIKNPKAKYPLPENVHPEGLKCFQILIPDEPHYIAAFRGALLSYASAISWSDDKDHTAKEVGKVLAPLIEAVTNCGSEGMQTLIEYNSPCALRWSYDNGSNWTEADLSDCAAQVVASNILFRVTDNILEVSLDGGETYTSIYDAKTIADSEITAQILFQVEDGNLQVSLNGGAMYTTIADLTAYPPSEYVQDVRQSFAYPYLLEKKVSDEWSTFADLRYYTPPAVPDYDIIPPYFVDRPAIGEAKTFRLVCRAGQHVMLPCAVKNDDAVQVSMIHGAWAWSSMQLTSSGAQEPPQWYTGDGHLYAFGVIDADTDPMFNCPKGALIARVSDVLPHINVYDTEPHVLSGITDEGNMWFFGAGYQDFQEAYPPEIDGVYARLRQLDYSGYVAFRVDLFAGGVPWEYTFDFAASDGSWVDLPDYGDGLLWRGGGNYINGVGWSYTDRSAFNSGYQDRMISIKRTFAETYVTTVEYSYRYVSGGNDFGEAMVTVPGTPYAFNGDKTTRNPSGTVTLNVFDSITELQFWSDVDGRSAGQPLNGDTKLFSVKVKGTGTNPFI